MVGFISRGTLEKGSEPKQAGDVGERCYCIDAAWYRQQGRSLAIMLHSRLCPSCQARQMTADEAIENIKRCCSQAPDYITPAQPLQEKAFRLLLANGGQPTSLADMVKELRRRSGVSPLAVSAKVLERVLSRDNFYGMRPAAAEPSDSQTST